VKAGSRKRKAEPLGRPYGSGRYHLKRVLDRAPGLMAAVEQVLTASAAAREAKRLEAAKRAAVADFVYGLSEEVAA
jgi:hypothetical protein